MKYNKVDDIRREQAEKVLWFNRSLWQRYSVTLFFFVNLYWFIFSLFTEIRAVVIPFILLIFSAFALGEQVKIYAKPTNDLKYSRRFFIAQLIMSLVLLLVSFSREDFNIVFPFLVYKWECQLLVAIMLLISIMICLLNMHALRSIKHNTDKFYLEMNKKTK